MVRSLGTVLATVFRARELASVRSAKHLGSGCNNESRIGTFSTVRYRPPGPALVFFVVPPLWPPTQRFGLQKVGGVLPLDAARAEVARSFSGDA